jgi:membrane associated rhomboid family serine protease
VLCSSIEDSIGALSTGIVFLGGGLLGGLFGAMVHCCTEKPYVEMSAAIYAFFGSIIGVTLTILKKIISFSFSS